MAFAAPDWIAGSNIYEVNLRQYTAEGSFQAFIPEIPRLRDMGVEILWLMPITPISQARRLGSLGSYYACSDYTAVNPEFGSMDDFRQLVAEAQRLGCRVIIDWVANHTGWDHRWTREHPDYYKMDAKGNFYDSNGWEDVIDLDYSNPELRRAVIEAMTFWVQQTNIDGFRCDMAMLVPLDFWREARTSIDSIRKLFWLAECEEPRYHEVFDASYTWKFLHKMEAFWRREASIQDLDQVLQQDQQEFPSGAVRVYFTSNHDENSHTGSEYERMGDAALPFAVFCCTWNGLPMLYSGQELPNLKRLAFFDRDPIAWTGKNSLNGFYKTLLSLHRQNRALRAADPGVRTIRLFTSSPAPVWGWLRQAGAAEVCVLLNLSAQALTLNLENQAVSGMYRNCFTGEMIDTDRDRRINLAAWGWLVCERK
jgi:alpha-amylase